MKKFTLYLLTFLLGMNQESNAQNGACCIYFNNGNGFMCIQKTAAECSALGGSFKGAGTPCTLDFTCPTTVCCKKLGENTYLCAKFFSQQDCIQSGSENRWFPNATCEVCPSGGVVDIDGLNAVYSESVKTVELTWQVNAAMGGEFYILRGRDKDNLKTIGYIDQSAASNGRYTYSDINPYQVGYYQLLYISNQKGVYSQILTVVAADENKLLLLPNPVATNTVRVLLNNMQLYNTEVRLHDLSGRQLGTWNLSQGKNEIDLPPIPQGVYIIRAKKNGQVYSSRLVKK